MLDLLFISIFIIIPVSIQLKAYFGYRFLLLENQFTDNERLIKFTFAAQHIKLKTLAFSLFPILSNAAYSAAGNRMRHKANVFLIIFYASLISVLGYCFLTGKYYRE